MPHFILFSRAHSSSSTVLSSPQILLQAVRSYIHFSQIRSWQEVGGKGHTPFPLRLVYRVCNGSGNCNGRSFSYSAHHHTFPPLPLSPHASLLVAVAALPRLPQIPQQLIATPTYSRDATPTCYKDATPTSQYEKSSIHHSWSNSGSRYQSSNAKLTSAPVALGVGRLAKDHPKEGFPFSPPLPSPLSPKLLMGLADRAPLLDGHVGLPDLERSMGKVSLVDSDPMAVRGGGDGQLDSDPATVRTAKQVNSDPVRTPGQLNSDLPPTQSKPSDNTRDGGGGAVPPASCSPAPFSRMHMGRERGGAKRRSCAITCKVSKVNI